MQVTEIKLTRGYVTLIDNCDADLAALKWMARTRPNGADPYASRANPNRPPATLHLHRLILARILGRELCAGEVCDHINGNTLDNRRSNLRLATVAENRRNSRRFKNNTTGYKGVSFSKLHQKFEAHIRVNYKLVHLGLFETAEEAHEAYKQAATKYFGEYARFE